MEYRKEAYRERRGLRLFETALRDLRLGFRQLRKNPGFTAVVMLTLSIAIGAPTLPSSASSMPSSFGGCLIASHNS